MSVEADWDDVDEAAGTLPEGRYLCRCVEINEKLTRGGDEYWRLTWRIENGEHAGKEFNDSVFFSPKALPRAKLLFESCGLVLKGRVKVDPEHVEGRQAWVKVEHEEFERRDGGTGKGVNVPFTGYGAVSDQETVTLTGERSSTGAPEAEKEKDKEEITSEDIPF